MSSDLAPTVRLNNHYQRLGRPMSISYLEMDNGPTVTDRWSIAVKIDGEVMGSGNAPLKKRAKEIAAAQALKRLGLE